MSNLAAQPTISSQRTDFYFTDFYCSPDSTAHSKDQQSASCEWKSCIGAAKRIVETEKGETAKILPFPPFQAPAFAKQEGRGRKGGQQQAGVEMRPRRPEQPGTVGHQGE